VRALICVFVRGSGRRFSARLFFPETLRKAPEKTPSARPPVPAPPAVELAKLFHPDHNHGASNAEDRQEHFIRVKRAYQTLSDPEARKVYNMSHNNWEVDTKRRPNLWKRGLREEPEGKDHILAREQFDEVDIRPDALITTCEMCGAPSHFNCYVCQMPVCRFCCLKPHAKDGVVPHYPIRDDPSAAEKSEEQEKKNRLLKYRDEFNPMWYVETRKRAALLLLLLLLLRLPLRGCHARHHNCTAPCVLHHYHY